jgi:hypothetical protein
VQRFRDDGHNVIEVLAERLGDFQPEDMRSLAQRFTKDAHGLLDTFANLVNLAPDIVNRMTDQRDPGSGHARLAARQLATAALAEGTDALAAAPESDDKRFLLALPSYVVSRDQ